MAALSCADVVAGRYRLDRLLGSGGAADVHRGLDLRLRRPVAVKVFRPGTGVDIEHDAQREAVLLARLRHPGLVTAYDAGHDDGRAFLVMELVEGTTLRRRIARGSLPAGRSAALGRDVARALAHAHGAGVVHRDVKPSNILLDASERPYLTDFGISRLLDSSSHTAPGTLVGTAAYLSPEQVLGRPVGCPSDVYALGLVVLECLTGRLEYGGGPLEAAIARLHRPPELPGDLPPELSDLVRGMTDLDEAARPDAEECARVLAEVAGSAGHTAAPAAAACAVPAASVVPAVPLDADPARTTDRTHPRQPPYAGPSAPRARTGRKRLVLAGAAAALGAAALTTALVLTDGSASPSAAASGSPSAQRVETTASDADAPGGRRTEVASSGTGAAARLTGPAASASQQAGAPRPGASEPAGTVSRDPGAAAVGAGPGSADAGSTASGTPDSGRDPGTPSAGNALPADTSGATAPRDRVPSAEPEPPREGGGKAEKAGKAEKSKKAEKVRSGGRQKKSKKG
ncbi:serine/threonine-protein kinase [Streptomyces sp. NPDC060194]|uniref:serine/threonine-protein kinase n=1 Tax=Streptomyces sp. NPDC060194 TaxID=3347069 RepID=UPI0036660598